MPETATPPRKGNNVLHVSVGSINPVKLDAVRLAFIQAFQTDTEIYGYAVESGVHDQPMSDSEAMTGAFNRAIAAQSAFMETNGEKPSYTVGVEGTLMQVVNHRVTPTIQTFDCGWIVVIDRNGDMNFGSTLRMAIPKKVLDLVHQGLELGDALDIVYDDTSLKQKQGLFGVVTDKMITRTSAYRDGTISALSRWVDPTFFNVGI